MCSVQKIPIVKQVLVNQKKSCFKRKLSMLSNEEDESDSHRELKKLSKSIDNTEIIVEKDLNLTSTTQSTINQDNQDLLSEKYLWLIALEYDNLNEWKQIGLLKLGLTKQDIDLIEYKYMNKDGIQECFYQMLLKWRLKQPENCNLNYLSKVFGKSVLNGNPLSSNSLNLLNLYNKSNKDLSNLVLNEKHLWTYSDLLCQEWKSLGRYLGLRETSISQIESKYFFSDGLRECCYQMLLVWFEQFNHEANLENLCLKLIDLSFNLYAKELIDFFC